MDGQAYGSGAEGVGRDLTLLPLRHAPRARAEGDPFSPAAVVLGGRRVAVREVLSHFLLEGEWWRGEEGTAIALRLLLEGGRVVTAIVPLREERDG